MSEHTHEWFVFGQYGHIEAVCHICAKNLSAHEIDRRLMQRDDFLAACIETESWLQDYVQNSTVVDGRAFDIGKQLAAAIADAEKEVA